MLLVPCYRSLSVACWEVTASTLSLPTLSAAAVMGSSLRLRTFFSADTICPILQ